MDVRIVAEIGASHNGKIENALTLIKAAKDAGADAVKLQTFEPEEMAIPGYVIQSGHWAGWELVELYKKAHTPKDWHEPLFNYARDIGIEIFSTPFSKSDVDFLETLDCPRYKIASFEACNFDLVEYAAQTGKPIIVSNGQITPEEEWELMMAHVPDSADVTLLHCISEYPTDLSKASLGTIANAKWKKIGISDHSHGWIVPVMAVSLGAVMIEKHISMAEVKSLDSKFAMDELGFSVIVDMIRGAEKAMDIKNRVIDGGLRRSLYYSQNLPAGTVLTKEHFKTARPNLGCEPYRMYELIGKTLPATVEKNEPVQIF